MQSRVRRTNFPDAWTAYPNTTPSVTGGSVYSNNMPIYSFDIPYTSSHSRANGDFVADPPRLNKPRYCAYSCGNPSAVDLIGSVANVNSARHY
jgi:hypothetical protein